MIHAMIAVMFLMAALIGWAPGDAFAGNETTRPPAFQTPETLNHEWLKIVEGRLAEVDPDTETIRIGTRDGGHVDFHYSEQTEVQGAEEDVVDCLSETSERSARVHFRTVDGKRMAVRIELLVNRTEADTE